MFSCQTFASPVKVLITTFDPFRGHRQNASQLVAEEMKKLGIEDTGIEFVFCNLPVEYEVASRKAIECYEKMHPKPQMVLSLGEAGCEMRLETRGHNLRHSAPGSRDNAGRTMRNRVIEPGGPEHETSTLPWGDMYCAVPEIAQSETVPSVSPGFFVCNDIAYEFGRYLRTRSVPFGFLHVPSREICPQAQGPAPLAQRIESMVTAAVRSLQIRSADQSIQNFCHRGDPMLRQLALVSRASREACLADYHRQVDLANRRFEFPTRGDHQGQDKSRAPRR